jgi:hypothetical protein
LRSIVRAGPASIPVIVLLAGLLALRGTADVTADWVHRAEHCASALEDRIAGLAGRLTWVSSDARSGVAAPAPGSTYALVTSGGLVVGLDRDGLVALHDTASDIYGVPALTGCSAVPTAAGKMLSAPEVVLGLSIIRAFEEFPCLMDMLSEVNMASLERPRAILRGGIVAELGKGGYRVKIRRLNQVVMQALRLKMRPDYVDLRFGRQVVVKCDKAQRVLDKEV